MTDPTEVRPHQTADFDQNFAKVNADLDRFVAVFRDVRANGPGPRALDIAGMAGHLSEIGTVPGLADLLAAAIVRLAEPAPPAEHVEHVEPTAEQQVRGVQAWMALDLHMALGLPVDHSADVEHQGRRSWSDWWAELLHRVRALPKEPAPPAELTEAQHVTVRRDDLDAVLTHIKYCAESDGDVSYGGVLSRLWAAYTPGEPTTELTEAQRHAERIILSHAEDIEFGSIGEMLDDEYERLGQDAGDQLRDEVDRLITDATVTVSWPERAKDGA